MQIVSGGCLCGAIRYSTETDPDFTAVCHGRTCQKQPGTALSVTVGLSGGTRSISGTLKTLRDTGDSDTSDSAQPWMPHLVDARQFSQASR